ncbi:MAG TPA: hypothetical protein PKW42_06250 [bacterium]|nr:hypothetical protein [bacterium]HPP12318.1 hypothetical protein [bacterium]
MGKQLLTNLRCHLLFFSRNGLLLAIVVVLAIHAGTGLFFSTLYESHTNRFYTIQEVTGMINGYSFVLVAALGILTIFSHLRDRCLKMVFTRPCPPEVWIFSLLLAIILVAAGLALIALLTGTTLFLVWKIPFQSGLVFVCMNNFLRSVTLAATLTFMSLLVHPVLAIFFVAAFQERTLFFFWMTTEAALRNVSTPREAFFSALGRNLARFFYYLVPIQEPFQEVWAEVSRSWVVLARDWLRLLLLVGYLMVFCSFLGILCAELLKRKRLV